ncbi:hypothetical protein B0T26DRAFT_657406 [Lasiosphaeria miniovina]|uniref:Uncharacterized protein n=1 Tax=Lasiosphaeria miniovina TaxID=1954250 RepID=A0AA39ZU30_9PEZI|nr:uncharacterized protein B0T26DRAFT_657406 [Lasiosphaeria miniovina]KAK0703697.1 hypothetical protein B0T26DRAFT_657406 [Lasiosphaeria miniovina]
MAGLQKALASGRTAGEPSRLLDAYTGRFYNAVGTFFLEIRTEGDSLKMRFCGVEEDEFVLHPH